MLPSFFSTSFFGMHVLCVWLCRFCLGAGEGMEMIIGRDAEILDNDIVVP